MGQTISLSGGLLFSRVYFQKRRKKFVFLLDKELKFVVSEKLQLKSTLRKPERTSVFPIKYSESYFGNFKWSMMMTFPKLKGNQPSHRI